MKSVNKYSKIIGILVIILLIVLTYFYIIPNLKKNNVNQIEEKKIVQKIEDNNYSIKVYKNKRTVNKLNYIELADDQVKNDKYEINNLIKNNKVEGFQINNLKIYNKFEEEKNTYFLDEPLFIVFDYELPKGLFYFKILIDVESQNNDRLARFTKLTMKRKGSGKTKDSPLGFEIFDTSEHTPVIIKKVKIIVYSAGEYELPVFVSVKNVNITLISKYNLQKKNKKDRDIKNSNNLFNKDKNLNHNQLMNNNYIKPVSGENSVSKIFINKDNNVADSAQELIEQDEDDCQKLNNELSRIGVLDNSDKVLTLLNPLLDRLEICANKGMNNAQEYIDLYYNNLESKQTLEIKRNGELGKKNLENLPFISKNNLKDTKQRILETNISDLDTNNKKNELDNELSQLGNLVNFFTSRNNNTNMDLSNGKAKEITNDLYTLN